MTEEVIAALKATGLAAFKGTMGEASKATEGVGKSATASAAETETAAKGMKGSGGRMAAGLAAAAGGAVIARKAFGFLKGAADDAGALSRASMGLSRTTGLDVKASSEWVSMTKERGLEIGKVQQSFGAFAKTLTNTARTGKGASASFEQLGLDAKVLAALPPDLRMGMVADSFKALPDGAEKTALAMQLFGKSGRDLLPILNMGAKGINEQLDAMDKFGLAVDQKGVAKQKELIKSQREMRAAMEGVKIQLGQALIPVMAQVAKALVPVVTAFNKLVTTCPALVPIIVGLAAAFAALMVLGSVGGAITAILPLLPVLAAGFTAVWAAVTGPIGLVVLGIAAVGAAFVLLYTKVGWFRDAVNAVWSWIQGNWPLLLGILTGPFGAAAVFIITHFDQVKAAASSVVTAVAAFFASLPGRVASVGRQVADTILNPLKAIPGQAVSIGRSIVEAIASGIRAAAGAIMSAIESILPVPPKKAAGGAAGLMSKLATGGIIAAQGGAAVGAGGTVLVGERGPELATMPAGTRITPLPPPMLSPSQLMGGGTRPIVTQVFLERRQIAEAVGTYTADQQAAR
jgi:hypothetical protein